jgi:uncharacterized membrane protein
MAVSEDFPVVEAPTRAPREITIIGIFAVVSGLILRFASRSPMWLDEALTVNIARLPVGSIHDALRHDGHPPLFYLLLHGWMQIFGEGSGAARALPGLFGVITIPLAFFVGRRRGGPILGWLTAAIVALSPFAVRYSDEARMYSLVMLLVLIGMVLVDDMLRLQRTGIIRTVGLVLTTAALLYTQYWALWICAAVGLLALWRIWKPTQPADRSASIRVVAALLIGLVLFIPWIPTMAYQSAHTATPWASAMRPTAVVSWTLCVFSFGDYADSAIFASVLVLLIVLALFGRARSTRSIELAATPRRQILFESLVVLFVLGISTVASIAANAAYAPRYAAVYFPLVALLAAAGLTRFVSRRGRAMAAMVLLVPMLTGSVLSAHEARSQSAVLADAIDASAHAGDIVVYCPDQLGPSTSREIRNTGLQQFSYPTGGPEFVDWVDYRVRNESADPGAFATELLSHATPAQTIYLVWNGEYRTFEGDCESMAAVFGAARAGSVLVEGNGAKYFEHATLIRYAP